MSGLLFPVAALGRSVLALLAYVGRVAIFAGATVAHVFRPPWYWREFGWALMQIGWLSLPVVGMTAVFTGGALALYRHDHDHRHDHDGACGTDHHHSPDQGKAAG